MKQLEYTVRFLTPAFLGNAEQTAQWRTPPFKALLRQWWRVAYAADKRFAVRIDEMRREEALLFGHAWFEHDIFGRNGKQIQTNSRKSGVRIRLDATSKPAWTQGTQRGVAPLSDGLATSYAWFGLIKRGGDAPDRTAIKAAGSESVRTLRLACPDYEHERLTTALQLANAFGTLGSRSRGGWGALHIDELDALTPADLTRYARPLKQCLEDDWAMSLAEDSHGLEFWESHKTFNSWDKAMAFIATTRKTARTALKTDAGNMKPALGFADKGRMPSPLRWKAIPADTGKGLVVRAVALPHRIPDANSQTLSAGALNRAWSIVADVLDHSPLSRVTG